MKAQDNVTYALIQSGQVAQLFTKEDMSEWNEENIHAIALDDEQKQWVEVGMGYDETTDSIIQPTLEEYKHNRLEYINVMFELESREIKGSFVPSDEQVSWEIQVSEAKAYKVSGKSEDCPMLATLAKARGKELSALCDKVIEKNTEFRENIAKLIGNRQALQDRIESCTNISEVLAVEYVSPLI